MTTPIRACDASEEQDSDWAFNDTPVAGERLLRLVPTAASVLSAAVGTPTNATRGRECSAGFPSRFVAVGRRVVAVTGP